MQPDNFQASFTTPLRKARCFHLPYWLTIIFGLLGDASVGISEENTLAVSPQTTIITAPLAADGLPDYRRYNNEKNKEGILPQDNLFVELLRCVDIKKEFTADQLVELYRELGIDPLPQDKPIIQEPDFGDIENIPARFLPLVDTIPTWDEYFARYLRSEEEHDEDPECGKWSSERELLTKMGVNVRSYLAPLSLTPDEIATRQADLMFEEMMSLDGPWLPQDSPYAAWVVRQNSPLLDQTAKALAIKTKCYSPALARTGTDKEISNQGSGFQPVLSFKRKLLYAYSLRLRQRAALRDFAGMRFDYQALLRLAKVNNSQRTLSDELVQNAAVNIAIADACRIFKHFNMPRDLLFQVRDDIRELTSVPDFTTTIKGSERLSTISHLVTTVRLARKNKTAHGVEKLWGIPEKTLFMSYDWDPAAKSINAFYDQLSLLAGKSSYTECLPQFQELNKAAAERASVYRNANTGLAGFVSTRAARSNGLGDYLLDGYADGWNLLLLQSPFRQRTRQLFFEVLIACELYKLDRNAYPGKLADLVPGYLPEVSLDPFSGKPFIYRSTGKSYIAYSVGLNLIDDGGQEKWHEDITFQTNDYAIGTPDQVPARLWFVW